MSNFVVGLTGGIGSGKSTVAKLFAARGIAIVDADLLARRLTAPGGAAMPALIARFGKPMLAPDGGLDRAAMRRRVLADAGERADLEAILHPLIRRQSAAECRAASSPYAICEVPLLAESEAARRGCDRILVIDCDPALQRQRVMARGLSEDEARRFMAAQASREDRLKIADDILVNDKTPEDLEEKVEALHQRYLEKAAAGRDRHLPPPPLA